MSNQQTSHTPGPWNISKHATPSHAPQFGVYADGDRYDLAIVVNENARANAVIISAAPDMLAALEQVLIASEDNGDMNDIDWAGIRAVIAKAKGEQ